MPIPLKFSSGLKISGSDWNDVRLYRPASYIVYKEGTQYYALGQYSGSTDYSGSNASTVIQAAIDALSGSDGGKIFISKGVYYLDKPLSVTRGGITIEGETTGYSELSVSPELPPTGTILHYTGSTGYCFVYTGSGGHRFFGAIRDLEIDGNQSGSGGIDIQGFWSDLWFERLFICDMTGSGIKIQSPNRGTTNGKTWNIWIKDCDIETNDEYGVWLTNTADWRSGSIDRVRITGCHFWDNKNSVRIDNGYISNILIDNNSVEQERQESLYLQGGRRMLITNNRIFDCGKDSPNTYDAINLSFSGSESSNGPIAVVIANNSIANHFGEMTNQRYSICLSGSYLQAIVCNNALDSGSATGTILNLVDSPVEPGSIVIRNNRKYVTENSGYASGSSGVYIAHKLSSAAANISVTASGSNPMLFSVQNSGSDGFYVYHTGSGIQYFYWTAKTKDAGSW